MKRIASGNKVVCGFLALLLVGFFAADHGYAENSSKSLATTQATTANLEAKVKKEFSYNPVGKRDPFEPLITRLKIPVSKPGKPKGPLEKFELGQFRLSALLLIKGSPRAMVKAPDGKSYIVKPGDKIGKLDGEIVKIETKVVDPESRKIISPDRIVIKEVGFDPYSNKKVVEYRYITM